MTVHVRKGLYGQQAAVAPTGEYGDDFDDPGATDIRLATGRVASGVEAGVTYGWPWVEVEPAGTVTDDCIWIASSRTGVFRDPFVTGGRPNVNYLLDEDLGPDLWVQATLLGNAVTPDFGICAGAPSPAADLTTGTAFVGLRSGGALDGVRLYQFPAESGGADELATTVFNGPDTVVRMELRGDDYTVWGDYPSSTPLTGTLPTTRAGNNRCGFSMREGNGATSNIAYYKFRCGSL